MVGTFTFVEGGEYSSLGMDVGSPPPHVGVSTGPPKAKTTDGASEETPCSPKTGSLPPKMAGEGGGVKAASQFGTSTGVGVGSSPLISRNRETNAKTINLILCFISCTATDLLSEIMIRDLRLQITMVIGDRFFFGRDPNDQNFPGQLMIFFGPRSASGTKKFHGHW